MITGIVWIGQMVQKLGLVFTRNVSQVQRPIINTGSFGDRFSNDDTSHSLVCSQMLVKI